MHHNEFFENQEAKNVFLEQIRHELFDIDGFCFRNMSPFLYSVMKSNTTYRSVETDDEDYPFDAKSTGNPIDITKYSSFLHFAEDELTGLYINSHYPAKLETYNDFILSHVRVIYEKMFEAKFNNKLGLLLDGNESFLAFLKSEDIEEIDFYNHFISSELPVIYELGEKLCDEWRKSENSFTPHLI